MNWLAPILADDTGLSQVLDMGSGRRSGSSSQFVILMAATMGVAVIAGVLCLIFFRKRPKKKHTHRSHRTHRTTEPQVETADEGSSASRGGSRNRRKWRRVRRPHRPRNPTLAETGGLPPIREGPPPAP